MERVIGYYRVSTKRQQRSGLGLEVQRAAVIRFAEAEGMNITGDYVEVETGNGADALDRRPQLAAALLAARKAKCSVLVSKLDRLSRDVAFISGLMARVFHCRRVGPQRRSVHAPPLCSTRRKGAAPDLGADEGCLG